MKDNNIIINDRQKVYIFQVHTLLRQRTYSTYGNS